MKRSKTNKDQAQLAMILMVLGMLILPGIDAIAKFLAETISAGQAAFARFIVQSLLMLGVLIAVRGQLRSKQLVLHAIRGLMLALATVFFFTAIKYLPLADAIAIFFVEPLLVTLMAAIFLNESIGWRRLSAILFGFAGAMLVIQPNFERFGWAAALPLATALTFAIYLLVTRSASQREEPETMQLYTGIFGALVTGIILLLFSPLSIESLTLVYPTAIEWLMLIGLGVVATLGHLLVVHAFKRAPVAVLAPFQYIEIISATLFGYLFFQDFPDSLTLLGIVVIISSGLYVFYRERKLAQQTLD